MKLVLPIVVLLLGCTERIELLAGRDAGSDAGCASTGCAPPPPCASAGETCGAATDCCTRSCVAGRCAAAAGCSVAGESCTASTECCSGACAPGGDAEVVCQRLGGCSPAGEICQTDAECCEAATGPGACEIFDPASGAGRCRASGACAQAGELCGSGVECCPGGAAGVELCRAGQAGGVTRCVDASVGTMCLDATSSCASPNECCSRICAPDDTDRLACADGCISNGRGCTRDADCCSRSCGRGLCRGGGPSCEPFGAPCTSSARCCSSLCAADTATCSVPVL